MEILNMTDSETKYDKIRRNTVKRITISYDKIANSIMIYYVTWCNVIQCDTT